ncbi:MAG TPA: hypothetical protein VFT22_33735 [Kofleriaceae bacterium]|nr:hypothetical protein [Kofleriaceae bacterium]
MRYDDAVASLYQVPVDRFVAERKRLAGELKAAGDKEAAARLMKLGRPPISAWVVDQLWWQARGVFEALFETAQRLREGRLDAMAAHREAIAKLRAEAVKILAEAEHGATEATLRRVTQTLSALAAAGGWDPDPPGALSADRDPPGFEAIGVANVVELPVSSARAHEPVARAGAEHARHGHETAEPARHRDRPGDRHEPHGDRPGKPHGDRQPDRRAEAEHARAAELRRVEIERARAAELRRAEAERAKAAAERHRLEAALRTARGDVTQREREVVKLERDLASARNMVDQARAVVSDLEDRLAQLHN